MPRVPNQPSNKVHEPPPEEYKEKIKAGQRIVIDCLFDDKMTEKELKSLAHQLMYVYGINRRSSCPSNLYVTGVGPKLTIHLQSLHYDKWLIPFTPSDYIELYKKEELIYLTADAKEILESINADKVYIIGGLVDRNRYKQATYNKAKEQGIAVARLPIAESIDIKATKVLTVNHTFGCVMKYIELKDWTSALLQALPLKKHATALQNKSN
eukprot:TRINITY_DN10788_c0_g1_i1.p1 TRINITY_DN10788_c0_g1~~TRINITY_DN10788_c0_g1_i1.p1  ORF type:complete len:211 (+),score=19.11 TRINITY_DN10788_c0_g1_i1:239-871(+)